MTSPHVRLAPGHGIVHRVRSGVIFLPGGDHDMLASIDDELDGDEIAEQLGDAVLDLADPPAFAFVGWRRDGSVIVMVRGDLDAVSDLAAMPKLSGSASPTWTEHHVRRRSGTVHIHVGDDPDPRTELVAGTVPAGGLSIELPPSIESSTPRSTTSRPTAPSRPAESLGSEARIRAATTDPLEEITLTEGDFAGISPSAADEPAAGEPPSPTSPSPDGAGDEELVDDAASSSSTGLTALADFEGDWAEESLGLDGPARRSLTDPNPDMPPPSNAPSTPPVIDGPEPEPTPTPARRPAGSAPSFPGDITAPVPAAPPAVERPTPPAPPARPGVQLVDGRRCGAGHPNPPHVARCRRCDLPLDLDAATITVERPVFAAVEFAGGSQVPIDRAVVVGRRPTLDDARVEVGAIVPVQEPTVSRTHLVVRVDGWNLLAVDCESSSGSAIVPADGSDPIELVPWAAHEVAVGDVLHLGGPTTITIVDLDA